MKPNIEEIKERVSKATAAPWYVSFLDDSTFMNCVAVTTQTIQNHPALPHDDKDGSIRDSIIATTLIQAPIDHEKPFVVVDVDEYSYMDESKGGKWDEDAAFIAHARTDIPELLDYIEELEKLLGR